MFKDTQEALKRLEEELLEEEQNIPTDTDELLAQLHAELDADVHAYNSDRVDTDVQAFARQVREPGREKLGGLVALAVLLTLGNLVLMAWWILRLLG